MMSELKSINQKYMIDADITSVWQALVDPVEIEEWGGGPAEMSDQEGEDFSLWGGEIHGTNRQVEAPKLLVQEWYSSDAPDQQTKVTFKLSENEGKTSLELVHENILPENYDDLSQGWKDYYLEPLKELVEAEQ
jgi:activator of HSP90 ATPase